MWVRNSENYLSDSEINLYVYSPNRGWWYLFYLILVLVAGGSAIAITLIVKEKEKIASKENRTKIKKTANSGLFFAFCLILLVTT